MNRNTPRENKTMALAQLDRTVLAEAYIGHTGTWVYDGFSADQWFAMAEEWCCAGRSSKSDEAYSISGRLRALDNNR